MRLEFSRQIFEKSSNISFVKIRPVESKLFYGDRQTDRHDEANSRFLQFSFYYCAVFVINIVNWFVHRTRTILTITEILLIFISFFPEDRVYKGKSVPLQAWTGPEGSRKLRFPDFVTTAQDGGKVVSLMHRPPLPPGNTPGTHFC